MDREDPITQFFPGEEDVDLYAVLSLTSDTSNEAIKKSYRRLALLYHPDKHVNTDDEAKAKASHKFQQIGFAYAVLSDEKRRQRYDNTGSTDEGLAVEGEAGWETYFEELFDRVTRGKLDEMKKEYQGSSEELGDLKNAYAETNGDIGEIMNHIPHSTIDDEPRFIRAISDLIAEGDLPTLSNWQSSIKDEKAMLVRRKQGHKEASEAEAMAKELGVWDEFYGTGKTGSRRKDKERKVDDEETDTSALQALILKKHQSMDGFYDNLAAKYAEPIKGMKGGKKGKGRAQVDGNEEPPTKRSRKEPDIDDEEFEKLQQKLFGDKAKSSSGQSNSKKARKSGSKAK